MTTDRDASSHSISSTSTTSKRIVTPPSRVHTPDITCGDSENNMADHRSESGSNKGKSPQISSGDGKIDEVDTQISKDNNDNGNRCPSAGRKKVKHAKTGSQAQTMEINRKSKKSSAANATSKLEDTLSDCSDSSESSSSSSECECEQKSKTKRGKAQTSSKSKYKLRGGDTQTGRKHSSKQDDTDSDESSSDSCDAPFGDEMFNRPTRRALPMPPPVEYPSSLAPGLPSLPNDDKTYYAKEAKKAEYRSLIAELERDSPTRSAVSALSPLPPLPSLPQPPQPLRRSLPQPRNGCSETDREKHDMQYKRVDYIWDNKQFRYRTKESMADRADEFSDYAFLVRRKFSYKNDNPHTIVDVKSQELCEVLREVMKDTQRVSLESNEPHILPETLFIYLEEFRSHYRETLKQRINSTKKTKKVKQLETQRKLCKTLVNYLDEEYKDVQTELGPLIAAGNITFDLLWALFDPRQIAVTSCYDDWNEPRCLLTDRVDRLSSLQKGTFYRVEGRCMSYNGKKFGEGHVAIEISSFKGPRKITSLPVFPLKSHPNAEKLQAELIERGRRFVGLAGMHFKFHRGVAFMQTKQGVMKVNINSRVMVDAATFIRVCPNYKVLSSKANNNEWPSRNNRRDRHEDYDNGASSSEEEISIDGNGLPAQGQGDDGKTPKHKFKMIEDDEGQNLYVAYEVNDAGDPVDAEDDDKLLDNASLRQLRFTERELLIASPLVLGFSFTEKYWLELSISGIREIEWNDEAFSSLVLPADQKKTIQALVKGHRLHGDKTIDDVVQGKGKGLVAVLHGPPGVGKTLTAEGVAEFLRCPLYSVSVGELGTDAARLEHELQKILDVAHCWSAVLLLDEADVFLEQRQPQDLMRNGLVSIFLRLLEYFQGVMFLTTNRINTFDEAFASRIHIGLRYGELSPKARKSVWQTFINKCIAKDKSKVAPITEEQYDNLARKVLNGRQIKNMVRTAQALALEDDVAMSLQHINRVIEVSESFSKDLKGGTGYDEAMRSYT